MMANQFNRNM